jgi:hypothetical protein
VFPTAAQRAYYEIQAKQSGTGNANRITNAADAVNAENGINRS